MHYVGWHLHKDTIQNNGKSQGTCQGSLYDTLLFFFTSEALKEHKRVTQEPEWPRMLNPTKFSFELLSCEDCYLLGQDMLSKN